MNSPYAAQISVEALAREAGVSLMTTKDGAHETAATYAQLERFAALVRAAALEEAARVCESREKAWLTEADAHHKAGHLNFRDLVARQAYGNGECAAAIRAIAATPPSPSCCGGGPQWGHAWNCPKCPD